MRLERRKVISVETGECSFGLLDPELFHRAHETNDPTDWQVLLNRIRVIEARRDFLAQRREGRSLAQEITAQQYLGSLAVEDSPEI